MKVRILTDTSTGIQTKNAMALGVELVRMPIIFGAEEFIDGVTITLDEFYHRLENGGVMPKTALINTQQFVDIFEDVKKNGDEMVVLCISKHLSATHENAIIARKQVGYDKIYIVDTLQTTTALLALVHEAVKMRDNGKTAREIFENCEKLKDKIKVRAALTTLKYLVAGGRLSKTSGAIGTILNLKPIVSIVDGKVVNIHKCVGGKSAFAYIKKLYETDDIDHTKPVYF